MSPEDYRNVFWCQLRDAIDQVLLDFLTTLCAEPCMTLQMLSHPPGSYKPISYEQMYSAVYKCVCKQYSDQLYADLMTHVNTRLAQWSSNLGSVADDNFILEFHKALVQYFHALGGIVPIFTYMNRLVKDIQNFRAAVLLYKF